MRLYDFCLDTYKDGERWRHNGFTCDPQSIATMVNTIYKSLKSGLQNSQQMPEIKDLLNMQLSDSGVFNANNLADLVAIVFDSMTEVNRNPLLWGSVADSENQAKHTFVVLFHGPHGEVVPNGKGAGRGNNYQEVKSQLIKDIDASYNHQLT